MPQFSHDVLVIGHGLAGTVLVHELQKRSLRFHVFDLPRTNAASIAAAGMVNPISLRRDVLTWRAPELLQQATLTYASIEKELGQKLWHPIDLVKIFPTPHEADQWERARKDPAAAQFLLPGSEENSIEGITTPHGHGIVKGCGWLDLRSMLALQRERLIGNGDLSELSIEKEQFIPIDGGIAVGERSAPWLVHCTGPFAEIPGLVVLAHVIETEPVEIAQAAARARRRVGRGGQGAFEVVADAAQAALAEGKQAFAQKDFPTAIDAFKRALATQPDNPEAHGQISKRSRRLARAAGWAVPVSVGGTGRD